jgi:small subunit ribosomal protein S18
MAMIRRERDRDKDRTENAGTRRRTRYLDPNAVVDVNDVEFLRRFMTEYGKIIPARLTGVTAAQQRDIKRGVRRARNLGLLA